jgi:hypothetical protein
MDIQQILNSSNKIISDNINVLAADYLEKTGKKVCRTCQSGIQLMVLTLKNYYNMVQFKLKESKYYRFEKGSKLTLTNHSMTDEKAIAFLKINPERIKLFSQYPSNWKDLIEGKEETEEDKETRLAIEAELKAASGEAPKPSKEDLEKVTLKELKEKYPEIIAISKADFIEKILAL